MIANTRKKIFFAALLTTFLIGLIGVFSAQAIHLRDLVVEQTLSNGMKVLVLERHQSPTVSLYLRFRVGMVDEGGKGIAHLLEHMLFKGTATVGTKNFQEEKKLLDQIDQAGQRLDSEKKKGKAASPEIISELEGKLKDLQKQASQYVVTDEMSLLYTENGAVGLNASTGADVTTYQVSLPSNRVKLWARLESDRFEDPVFREFYSERDVVSEERRQTKESEPFSKLIEQFLAVSYLFHPYRNPIIGWEPEYISKTEMEKFFHTYYVPNNAVITAVGDVQADEFIELVKRSFASFSPSGHIPILSETEPPQLGERRVAVNLDAQPQLIIGYHKPTLPTHEDYVFDLVESILTGGRTSRLYRRLVEKDQIAVRVDTVNGMPGARCANLFTVMAAPRYPHTVQEVERVIYEEIDRLKKEPVPDREIQKVKNQMAGNFIRSLNSNAGLASELSYFESVAGDWRYIDTHLEVLDKITPGEIQECVQKYLTGENRTVAFLVGSSSPNPAMPDLMDNLK